MKYLKKNTLTAVIVGLLAGTAAAEALAITSAPTVTVKGHAPVLTAGQIIYEDKNANGVLDIGDIVKIDVAHTFGFSDVDVDTQTADTYSWKVGGTEVATSATYTIVDADLGKSILLTVTPHTDPNITDPAVGLPVDAVTPLAISAGNTILSVTITGGTGTADAPIVGDTLTATATCTKACDTVNYQWQVEDAVGSGQFTNITGATNKTWQVTTVTQKRKIQVIATNPIFVP
ncbi:TPA: ZirU family protein [Yersinia enterocolitica]